jgi:hypothetical protein
MSRIPGTNIKRRKRQTPDSIIASVKRELRTLKKARKRGKK